VSQPAHVPSANARVVTFYRAYGPALRARCRRLLRDDWAAEDATQEVFLRVLRHVDRAPSGDDALKWMYRIATNYCLNDLRDRKRSHELRGDLDGHGSSGERSGEDALTDRDLVRRVTAAVPENQRAASLLHHLHGLTQEEVAGALGISRRTVVNRLSAFQKTARRFASRPKRQRARAARGA
jgi:RNA polymerase sigma-70 factor (ECF subfamily)